MLKTLKADSEKKINLSSYDIAAIMYHMIDSSYLISNSPLRLVKNSIDFLKMLYDQDLIRESLEVPDKSRKVFRVGGATRDDLLFLLLELFDVYEDVLDDLSMSGGTINKEIVAY